jgi:Flp pilus assembly protein TadB
VGEAVRGRLRTGGQRLGEHDVALAADLVVAVVEAGVPLPAAVQAVAAQLPGSAGAGLGAAARLLTVGAAPSAALSSLLAEPAAAPVARAVRAALESGASPVPLLEAAAGSQRERARSARLRRARGLGSRAALPLSLCFLPAFVLVAVVPVVLGGLSTVLSGS